MWAGHVPQSCKGVLRALTSARRQSLGRGVPAGLWAAAVWLSQLGRGSRGIWDRVCQPPVSGVCEGGLGTEVAMAGQRDAGFGVRPHSGNTNEQSTSLACARFTKCSALLAVNEASEGAGYGLGVPHGQELMDRAPGGGSPASPAQRSQHEGAARSEPRAPSN